MSDFADKICNLALKHFSIIPKTGKPTDKEWTILSCIIQENNNQFEVVALGTGSKCIGQDKLSSAGDILNDSHAEVMCRRSFIRYIYESILKSQEKIIKFNETVQKFTLNEKLKFHFFTTHVPCGDAAIFPKPIQEDVGSPCRLSDESEDVPTKKIKLDDIFRTGAKCLENDTKQDLQLEGTDFHTVGAIRTKPGRGVRTLSVSCSDKLAKWCHLGIQGALLSILLDKPIYLNSFIIAGNTPFNQPALERALYIRLKDVYLESPYKSTNIIAIYQASVGFKYAKTDDKNPSPNSIGWYKKCDNSLKAEIAVDGKKLGVTKKNLYKPISRLSLCKLELFNIFMVVLKKFKLNLIENFDKMNYKETKMLAKQYQNNWATLKERFGIWTIKDTNLLLFYYK